MPRRSERANHSTITEMAQQQETLSDRSMVVVLAILLPEDSVLWLCLRSTPRIQSLNCARDTVASEVAAGLSGQWTDGGDDSSIVSLTRRPTHLQGSGVWRHSHSPALQKRK